MIKSIFNIYLPKRTSLTFKNFIGYKNSVEKPLWGLFNPINKEESNMIIETDRNYYFDKINRLYTEFSFPLNLKKYSFPILLSNKYAIVYFMIFVMPMS